MPTNPNISSEKVSSNKYEEGKPDPLSDWDSLKNIPFLPEAHLDLQEQSSTSAVEAVIGQDLIHDTLRSLFGVSDKYTISESNYFWRETGGTPNDLIDLIKDKNPAKARELYQNNDAFRSFILKRYEKDIDSGDISSATYDRIWWGEVSFDAIAADPTAYYFDNDFFDMHSGYGRYNSMTNKITRQIFRAKFDLLNEKYPFNSPETPPQKQSIIDFEYSKLAAKFLELSGCPHEYSGDITSAATYASYYEHNSEDFFNIVVKTAESVKKLGAHRVATLHEQCGILNFGNYNSDSLISQYNWLQGDPQLATKYADKSSPTVLSILDGIGDHNGAFRNTTGLLGAAKSAIFFEVGKNTNASLAKYQTLLSSMSPYISTLIIGGHGDPSGHGVNFGDANLTSKLYERNSQLTWETPTMTNLLQFVQPDTQNKRNIIIKSCSQGKRKGGVAEQVAKLSHANQPAGVTTRVFAMTEPTSFSRYATHKSDKISASHNDTLAVIELSDKKLTRHETTDYYFTKQQEEHP